MSTTTSSTTLPAERSKPRKRARLWLKRGLVGLTVTIAALAGIGTIYQALSAARDQRIYTPPGQLVDIGGRRIHMLVMGQDTGLPTVILEAGMATFSSNFFWVQSELAASTRVVTYDRAGLGWSDPSPEPQDARQSALDLHAALEKTGVSGPYVIAGHSYGGLVVRAFADLYPADVVGMVLIDASHPDQWARIPASRGGQLNGRGNLLTGFVARLGVVRLLRLSKGVYAGLPEQSAAEMAAILARPETWQTSGEALLLWSQRTRAQVNQARSLGDLPLAVISVTEQALYADVLTSLQAELPALSSNSIHHTQVGATHEGLVAEREHALAVAGIIQQVLQAARTGQPLAQVFR